MRTYSPTFKDLSASSWHHFDAKDQVLGRLSTRVAAILMGKHRPGFAPHLVTGDHVVVTNAAFVRVTGKKEYLKAYYRHSGYPGGLKVTALKNLRAAKPERILIHAVSGMLPDNKLKPRLLARLHVFSGSDHPFVNQVKNVNVG